MNKRLKDKILAQDRTRGYPTGSEWREIVKAASQADLDDTYDDLPPSIEEANGSRFDSDEDDMDSLSDHGSDDSDEERDSEPRAEWKGDGGGFSGAGASGSWSDDEKEDQTMEDDGETDDNSDDSDS